MASAEVATTVVVEKTTEEKTKTEEEKDGEKKNMGIVPSLSESPKAWLLSLQGGALRKLGYVGLEWLQSQLGLEKELPGAGKKEVTPTEFVDYLKDGAALCKLANILRPGAVSEVHEASEGEELSGEKKKANLEAFKNFAKVEGEVADADLFKTEKVEKGKGFKGLLATLIGIATKASEKFSKEGLSIETLTGMGVAAFGKQWLVNLVNRFFKRGQGSVKGSESNGDTAAPATADPKDDIPDADADSPKEEKKAE